MTPAQARRALRQSTEDLARLFESALTSGQPRVKGMPRRAINMLAYLMQHDAHHRGQRRALAQAVDRYENLLRAPVKVSIR